MKFPEDLIPGDILLYSSHDIVDAVIEWKEGDNKAHVEQYIGFGKSIASRNGIGVNTYPFRPDGLVAVRRLKGIFDEEAVKEWMAEGVSGLPYGFGDIVANAEVGGAGSPSTDLSKTSGVDCSHLIAASCEVGGVPQFDTTFAKNKIEPSDFDKTLGSVQIYP